MIKDSCLIVYSDYTGNKSNDKKVRTVEKFLSRYFKAVSLYKLCDLDEFSFKINDFCSDFEYIIVCSGDGLFNYVVNKIMAIKEKPILGYLNFGTLGDVGKNFGITKNLKKSLKVISKKKSAYVDLGKIENHYFVYMASTGAFSTIASSNHVRGRKLTYYLNSFRELFNQQKYTYQISINDGKITAKPPFLMILNGKFVGGFKINKNSLMDDGKAELFYSKSNFLNSIPSYFLRKNAITIISNNLFKIESFNKEEQLWCLDGELFKIKDATIRICANSLKILTNL